MQTQDPLTQLLTRMTATPALDKLSTFAAGWKAIEAQERADEEAERDRRLMDVSDEICAADRDDGEEVAA